MFDGGSAGQSAAGIVGDASASGPHSGWNITGNTITSDGVAISIQDVTASTISGNTLTVQTAGTNVLWTSERNNLTDLFFTDNILSGSGGVQVVIVTDYNQVNSNVNVENQIVETTITGLTIHGNKFSNWDTRAIKVGDQANVVTGTVKNISITDNTFNDNHSVSTLFGTATTIIGGLDAPSATGSGNIFNVSSTGKIQTSIDAAFAGDTINVAAGPYVENLSINKSITLQGADKVTTFIDANHIGVVVTIMASNVTIKGFTIKNSGTNINTDAGIGVVGVSSVTLEDNIITDNVTGVAVMSSSGNSISNNEIKNSARYGIVLEEYPYAPGVFSKLNTISRNTIINNARDGIYAGKDCNSNIITGNNISGATGTTEGSSFEGNGIYLWRSAGNTITGNNIADNRLSGIELRGSKENIITGNEVRGNFYGFYIWNIDEAQFPGYSIRNNNISENRVYSNTRVNLYANPNFSFNIENNWWGSSDRATVVSKLASWDTSGDVVFGTTVNLDFRPYYIDSALTTLSDKTDITSFTFPGQTGTVTIDNVNHTVAVDVRFTTDVTSLTPTITTEGLSVSPASGSARDFTLPQTYTVTPYDEETPQDYIVTVTVVQPPVIAIADYNRAWTNHDITVTASTNQGTLNFTSHTFTANGDFTFVATDAAGNTMRQTVTISNIDKVAPIGRSVVINGGDTWTTSENVSLTLGATDALSGVTKVRIGNDLGNYFGPYDFDPDDLDGFAWTLPIGEAGEGEKTVYVIYVDAAGNESAVYTGTIWVDTIAPVITGPIAITPSVPNGSGLYIGGLSTITMQASDTGGSGIDPGTCRYSVDGGTTFVTVPTAYGTELGYSQCVFTGVDTSAATAIVTSVDDYVGNSAPSSPITVTVDDTVPTNGTLTWTTANHLGLNVVSPFGNLYTISPPLKGEDSFTSLNLVVNDDNIDLANVPVYIDGSGTANGNMVFDNDNGVWSYVPGTPVSFTQGTHFLRATFADLVGNTTTLTTRFRTDRTAPTGGDLTWSTDFHDEHTVSPVGNLYEIPQIISLNDPNPSFSLNVNDNNLILDNVDVYIDEDINGYLYYEDGSWYYDEGDWSDLSDGAHELSATFVDRTGYSTKLIVEITIDSSAPVITIGTYETGPTNKDIVVNATTDEGTLDADSHTFSENGCFTFTATDAAGNSSDEEVCVTNIDKVLPVVTLTGSATVTLTQGGTFTDPGATSDDGSLVTTTSAVNTAVAGTYTLSYSATDASGNVAILRTRTVNVVAPAVVQTPAATVVVTPDTTGNTEGVQGVTTGDTTTPQEEVVLPEVKGTEDAAASEVGSTPWWNNKVLGVAIWLWMLILAGALGGWFWFGRPKNSNK